MRPGVRRDDGDTFFGCNFLSAPATERFDQSLNPRPAPIWLASRHPAYHPPRRTCTDWPLPLPPPPPPSLPPIATQDTPRRPPTPPYHRPISPPYRCSITFAMHFFPSSFFIKLDYNCIASSSCGIAGRKNGTLPGMRVHPRSTGPRGERKEGRRGCGRANDRFWRRARRERMAEGDGV